MGSAYSKVNHQIFTTVGTYNTVVVAVRRFPKVKIELKRDALLEFKKVRIVHNAIKPGPRFM